MTIAFNQGGSVNIDITGQKIEFQQNKYSYTILNLGVNDVFVQFGGEDVTAEKTTLGEGKLWMISSMGIEVPTDVHSLFAKTGAGNSDLLVIKNERVR